jgi:predicted dehydrogenase
LLKRDDIHIVSICTPPFNHAELAIAALEAGKHVLVEKANVL